MTLSIYQQVTNTILCQLETADPKTWVCPWHRSGGGLPTNALTGRSYRGINVLSLWCGARGTGFITDKWASYRQWGQLGAQVRRGEKGTLVVFYRDNASHSAGDPRFADDMPSERRPRFVAKASVVFNAAQVEGGPDAVSAPPPNFDIQPGPTFDTFVADTGATIHFDGSHAAYNPVTDEICLPPATSFRSTEGYTSTLAHELVHWTGAKHRLNRDFTGRFGSRAYAAEELVAELGSAFILATLGLVAEPHPQHAVYMAGWLPLLKSDPRAIFTAAAAASSAADYLHSSGIHSN